MGARISYMPETPQLQRRRTRRREHRTHSGRTFDLRGPSSSNQYARAHAQQETKGAEVAYLHSRSLLDYSLSAVSLNPEYPPGLSSLNINSGKAILTLSSIVDDGSSERGSQDSVITSDSTLDAGHYILALDGHLSLWIPQGSVIEPRTPHSPTDVVSDASETRILYSAQGDVDGSLDMIVLIEQVYVQLVPGDDISTLLPALLGTSESDPFSKVVPLNTLRGALDGIDAHFLTPSVDKGANHIRRVLLWNKDTGGVIQRLTIYLTDDAALNRARELATLTYRIVASVAPGPNTFNLARRRHAIDFMDVMGAERLLLEAELPENIVWTIDKSPAGGKMATFHKVSHGGAKHGYLTLTLGPYHSSKCTPCPADDTAEHCIIFGQQTQWRSLRDRSTCVITHKCCTTVPLSTGPEEVHLYFEHVSESLDMQFKQLVQSMSWMTAPKPQE